MSDQRFDDEEREPERWESLLLAAEFFVCLPFDIACELWFAVRGQRHRRMPLFFRWTR